MTAYDKLKTLQAAVAKELIDLKKKRDAAHAKAQSAFSEFKKLDALVKERETALGGPSTTKIPEIVATTPTKKGPGKKAAKVEAKPTIRLKKDGTPAKKPGPAKKSETKAAAPAKPAKAAPTKKAAPVKAAKKAAPAKAAKKVEPAKKAAKSPKNRAAEGRRAVLAGERPTLKDAMKTVMGKNVMNSQEVYDALKAKGWLPNSNEPKNYIGYSLSSMKTDFERVPDKGRGFYRAKSAASANGATKAETTKADAPASDTSLADAAEILGVN